MQENHFKNKIDEIGLCVDLVYVGELHLLMDPLTVMFIRINELVT